MRSLTRNQLTIFSIAILLVSCQVEEKHEVNFHQIETDEFLALTGTEMSVIDSGCYYDGMLTDSMLLLTDGCNDDFLYGFDLRGFNVVFEAGRAGQGPGDFISVPFFSQSNNNNEITVWDPAGFLKEAKLEGSNLVFPESNHLNVEFGGAKTVSQIGDRVYASKHRSAKGIGLYHDMGAEDVQWVKPPDYIQTYMDDFVSGDELGLPIGDNNMVVGDAEQFVAVGMKYFNNLFFIDSKGTLLKSFLIGRKEEQYSLIAPTADRDMQFLPEQSNVFIYDSYVTDHYFYFLSYAGESLYNFQNHYDYGNPHLLVFDYEMNFVSGFSFDRMLTFICISPDDKRLFGGAMGTNDLTAVVEYQLDL